MSNPKVDWEEEFSYMMGCHKTGDLPDIQEYYAASPSGFTEAEKTKWRRKRVIVAEEIERRKPKKKK